jgi:cyclic pyranopterin phosphate synthase
MAEFSHVDKKNDPVMVDVGDKTPSTRLAVAESKVSLPKEVLDLFEGEEIKTPKGPVFQTAIIAGIQAVKKTSGLIPLCHPLVLDNIGVKIELVGNHAVITCSVRTDGKTGVEMEALTGASVAALTIYDMCKAFSHQMTINTRLKSKSGGKRDYTDETP